MPTANTVTPVYNEDKEIEMFFDFNGAQILKINTTDPKVFLEAGKNFYDEIAKKGDAEGRCKVIYIMDKMPPLTSILSFITYEFPKELNWTAFAAIAPSDLGLMDKFVPIVTYGLDLTNLKGRYVLNLFNHKYKYDLKDIFQWLDLNIVKGSIGGLVSNT